MDLVSIRRDVAFVMAEYGYSERQACKLVDMDRSSYWDEARPDRNERLRQDLVALARQKPRFEAFRRSKRQSRIGQNGSRSKMDYSHSKLLLVEKSGAGHPHD
jgi:hypothetical protein